MSNQSNQIQKTAEIAKTIVGIYVCVSKGSIITKQLQYVTNPQNIIKFTASGFDINMKNMEVNIPYIITFEGSKYIAQKNNSNELVITEMS